MQISHIWLNTWIWWEGFWWGPWARPPSIRRWSESQASEVLGGVGFLTTLGVGVGFFCRTPTPEVQLDHFLHHTPNLGIHVEMVGLQFLLKLLLKQIILSVYHDLHWLLVATKLLTVKRHSLHVKEWELETEILPPTQQTWLQRT